ncbi:MAG TPA: (2Fe-2S)-binding protein [Amycolatopsis sp.]|nr:(2Fe-2S)-binding protein [Amycolatopsis sp.]
MSNSSDDTTGQPADDGDQASGPPSHALTRRIALQWLAAATTAAAATPFVERAAQAAPIQDVPTPGLPTQDVPASVLSLNARVNGRPVSLPVDARTSLLDLIREHLGLGGTKKGCDHGQCGACTVHVDDQRVLSCLTLAAKVEDRDVTTIEGLSDGKSLHPMQKAFVDNDALQCGYCTPGQIMAAVACVKEGNAKSEDSIREYMSGNICRCGAYVGIVAAIQEAAPKMRQD